MLKNMIDFKAAKLIVKKNKKFLSRSIPYWIGFSLRSLRNRLH